MGPVPWDTRASPHSRCDCLKGWQQLVGWSHTSIPLPNSFHWEAYFCAFSIFGGEKLARWGSAVGAAAAGDPKYCEHATLIGSCVRSIGLFALESVQPIDGAGCGGTRKSFAACFPDVKLSKVLQCLSDACVEMDGLNIQLRECREMYLDSFEMFCDVIQTEMIIGMEPVSQEEVCSTVSSVAKHMTAVLRRTDEPKDQSDMPIIQIGGVASEEMQVKNVVPSQGSSKHRLATFLQLQKALRVDECR